MATPPDERDPREPHDGLSGRKLLAARAFALLDDLRATPPGRALAAVARAVDPVVYASWYATEWLRTRNPVTFDDKVRYKMVRDRRPILTTISDKVAVRPFVAERVGERYLTEALQIVREPDEIAWEELPREFVAKVTHASGGALVVTEAADPERPLPRFTPRGHARLLVHPDALDRRRAAEIVDHWLRAPYGWSGWKREWAYRNVEPRILVEEYLRGPGGAVPADYKMYMFHGRVGFIQLDRDRYGTLSRDLYDEAWEYLPVSKTIPRSGQAKPRPERLDEMIDVAQRLSSGFDFVRVDLYALEDRIVFGELTIYPASGQGPFDPPEFGRTIGDMWEVPRRYA
jgi:hypothetical protein